MLVGRRGEREIALVEVDQFPESAVGRLLVFGEYARTIVGKDDRCGEHHKEERKKSADLHGRFIIAADGSKMTASVRRGGAGVNERPPEPPNFGGCPILRRHACN